MKDGSKKGLTEKPSLIFLLTFVSLTVPLTILAMLNGQGSPFIIGTYFLYGGTIVTIIGFFFLNKGGNSRASGLTHLKSNEQFKKAGREEKPFERIVWSVLFAGVFIAAIGYFLVTTLAS